MKKIYERLAHMDVEELIEEVKTAAPRQKTKPLAYLLTSPDLQFVRHDLLSCGSVYEGRTGKNETGKRVWRCKLPMCGYCQLKASSKAKNRAVSLFEVGTGFNPNRDHVTFLTIDEVGHDLERFKAKLAKVLKSTKGHGVFQVGMSGLLHWHGLVQHVGMSRKDLVLRCRVAFPQKRAVRGKKIEDPWMADGIEVITGYFYRPAKNRDLHRMAGTLDQPCIENWVRVQELVEGKRTHEWGFTREERKLARDWGNKRSSDLRKMNMKNTGFTGPIRKSELVVSDSSEQLGMTESTELAVSGSSELVVSDSSQLVMTESSEQLVQESIPDLVTENVIPSSPTSSLIGDSHAVQTDGEKKRGYTAHTPSSPQIMTIDQVRAHPASRCLDMKASDTPCWNHTCSILSPTFVPESEFTLKYQVEQIDGPLGENSDEYTAVPFEDRTHGPVHQP